MDKGIQPHKKDKTESSPLKIQMLSSLIDRTPGQRSLQLAFKVSLYHLPQGNRVLTACQQEAAASLPSPLTGPCLWEGTTVQLWLTALLQDAPMNIPAPGHTSSNNSQSTQIGRAHV